MKCPICGSYDLYELGKLGRSQITRCRDCGITCTKTIAEEEDENMREM